MDSALKLHGAKHYLAKKIVATFPPRKSDNHPDGWLHYVEPFAGTLAVLLAQNPEGISEVANDLDEDLANFWACLRDGIAFGIMRRQLEAMPFSERDWQEAGCPDTAEGYWANSPRAPVDRAIAFFVRCRQSMAGRQKCFAPLSRTRTRRGMNEQASAWLNAIEGLPEVHERLKRVVILNRSAVEVIRTQDGPNTLFYLDPPYCPDTRTAKEVYRHEMTAEQHEELLALVIGCKGKFAISGYRNDLYDRMLSEWKRHEFSIANHAAGGDTKRRMVECLWVSW